MDGLSLAAAACGMKAVQTLNLHAFPKGT